MIVEKALYSDGLDGVDALLEIEQVFDIKVPDEVAVPMQNVGHLYDYIVENLPSSFGKKCATSMAFYHLRRDLKIITPNLDLKPTTQLHSISKRTPKDLWFHLNQTSEINLPQLEKTIIGNAAFLVGLISVCTLLLMLIINPTTGILLSLALLVLLSFILTKMDPMQFPKTIQSLGDLARETSRINYGKLLKEGARTDKNDHWNILTQILADFSEPLEKENITRSTPFY